MACVGINGFGRIGRLFLRAALAPPSLKIVPPIDVNVVAINDPSMKPDHAAYLFKYDSAHRTFTGEVCADECNLIICGKKIPMFQEKEPCKIPWGANNVSYVVESSGQFTNKEQSEPHIDAGAKRVIISAPSCDAPTYVMGVNHCNFDPCHEIISMGSCTTNALAPIAKLLNDKFKIAEALFSTVHAVTPSQRVVDMVAKDWREGRSVFNTIPGSTGAARAVVQVIPELKDRITGNAYRVPVIDGSVLDLNVKLCKETKLNTITQCIQEAAADGPMAGILGFTSEELVSSDVIGTTQSAIYDCKSAIELSQTFFKLVAWYDNEYAYATRLVDLIRHIYCTDQNN